MSQFDIIFIQLRKKAFVMFIKHHYCRYVRSDDI